MECLFSTTTKYTLEEYKKFNWSVIRQSSLVFFTIFSVILLVLGILLRDIFSLVFVILYPIIFYLIINRSAKKTYNSNKIIQNVDTDFEFYDTYFIEKNMFSESRVEYNQLYKIIETKTNFYLMNAKNQGYMLNKSNFPEGLNDFLRTKKSESKTK